MCKPSMVVVVVVVVVVTVLSSNNIFASKYIIRGLTRVVSMSLRKTELSV